ncbi:MAG: class F sortase [Patescibacteria group bacterium]
MPSFIKFTIAIEIAVIVLAYPASAAIPPNILILEKFASVPIVTPLSVSEDILNDELETVIENAPEITTNVNVDVEPKKIVEPEKPAPAPKKIFSIDQSRLIIPTISLDKPIAPVGLTPEGDMDVLDDPSRVGWFNGRALPGEVGSAVIGAHVYQAFANLKKLKVGDEIYVKQADGSQLRFEVEEIAVIPYTDTTHLPKIFNRTDGLYLNLITCHGEPVPGKSTYTHRLVVYTKLVATT